MLCRIGKRFADAGRVALSVEQFRTILRRPKLQPRRDTVRHTIIFARAAGIAGVGKQAQSGLRIRYQRHIRDAEILPIALVVAKEKETIGAEWAAERSAVIIAQLREL